MQKASPDILNSYNGSKGFFSFIIFSNLHSIIGIDQVKFGKTLKPDFINLIIFLSKIGDTNF